MGLLFANDLHDEFAGWLFGYISAGGPEFGEIAALGRAVGAGDDADYCAAFVARGNSLVAEAEAALAAGHEGSAGGLFLKASAVFAAAYHPLYGSPVDPRLVDAYRRQIAAMDKGLALLPTPGEAIEIPFEGAVMRGVFLPAEGAAGEVRPLVIFTNGYDATITDLLFSAAIHASRRGYHSLMFDGPGQGGMLYEQGVPTRPDWEVVLSTVLDAALARLDVDPQRIALNGMSFGGYLAPRAASAETRIAALIADPLLPGLADGFRGIARKFGASDEELADLSRLDPAKIAAIEAMIASNPGLRWKIVQRGYWVHGISSLAEYLAAAQAFTLEGRLEAIRCPTLVALAEEDGLAAGAPAAFEKLTCPKTLIRFTAAEGAGDHCEMGNRSLFNSRIFDWLDDVFAGKLGYEPR